MIAWFRSLLCILLAIGTLLSLTSCAPRPSLFSEEEVLEILSERYGSEFVVTETLENNLPRKPEIVASKLYAVASYYEPANTFWVQQNVVKSGGIFVSYGLTVDDTLASDYLIKQFSDFLLENEIHFLFRKNDIERNVSEYLTQPHTRGGVFVVFFTKNTVEDIVNQVFDFTESLDTECFNEEIKRTRVVVSFCDE